MQQSSQPATAPSTEDHPIARFQQLFAVLRPDQPMALEQVYAPEIVFEDPLHKISGLPALRAYFERLNSGLVEGRFEFAEPVLSAPQAVVPWVMHLQLKRIRRPIVVPGCSHIRFADYVTYQRDYFDAGAMIYEQIPVLGWLIRRIKSAI